METETASVPASSHANEHVTQLVAGASARLAHLSNDELLAQTRYLVGKTNQVLAALLEHLGEVEARGIHRLKRCSGLYTYCIYELRFSEDAASRRASAARLTRQFPAVLDAIAKGELHLTGLLQIAPILTEANHLEVLGRAKFRTKKEIAKLMRRLAPLPEIPDRIEPTGAALPKASRNPTWAQFVESFCPPVRDLPPGERPSDWAKDTVEHDEGTAPARESDELAPLPPLEEPQLYQMQFTTTEEHAELVEKAKALLSHGASKLSLGELHLRAMRLLVETIEKQRFGAKLPAADTRRAAPEPAPPRQRSRAIPAAIRRQVYERDAGCCTFVDDCGQRCSETHLIELHHLVAFAKGGLHEVDNLTLRCAAHNTLAAEQDFGERHMALKRHSQRHEARRTIDAGARRDRARGHER